MNNRNLKSSGFCSAAEEPDSLPEKPAGKRIDVLHNDDFGCGKPVRYIVTRSEGVTYGCNKYSRCPSWEELNAKLIETTTSISELLQWLRKREGELEESKERTSSTGKRANFGSQAKAYRDVQSYIEQRIKTP